MSFDNILQALVNGCGGGLNAALMQYDGIPITQVQADGLVDNPLGGDLSTAGAEFGRILGEIHKASSSLGGGAVAEVVVKLSRFILIFREVDEDVVLVLALRPDGNLGKARYLMRRHLSEILDEL
jgi:predicted regulator of Ras-like GTPase activity (Roadblock/LC7/MglB family)